MKLPDGDYELDGIEIVGYHDLDGRPGFKMALREDAGKWFLYLGRLWHPGWTILDVTDPTEPVLVRSIEGPPNTWTIQVQVAGDRMITSLEKIDAGWGDDPQAPFEEGFLVWEVADPAAPRVIGRFQTGGNGTHRNFYDGGPLVHLAAAAAGFDGHIYQIVDIANPAEPRSVGRWWIPGQWRDGGEAGVPEGTSLHAPFVVGDRAYLAYGAGGLVVLDISDPSRPRSVSCLGFAPPFNPVIAVHTAVPFPDRGLVAVNSEAIEEDCSEPLGFAGLVDITNESAPRVISMFPVPAPSPGAPYRNFCEHGGRFGPHNLHQAQGQTALENRSDRVYLTYFNAGLRVIDVSDPRLPREVASFVPPDPVERRGILPRTLVAQTEDVLVDARGFVYVTDKNHGVHILRVDSS